MCPEFSDAIDLIVEFWKEFSESKIRNIYNYIKHKGTPCYKEIESLRDTRFFSLIIGKESYPTDIRDVRKVLSIDELTDELIKFDDEKLYPYVVELIKKLKIESQNTIKNQRLSAGSTMIIRMKNVMMSQIM